MPERGRHLVGIIGAGIGGAHLDGYLELPDRFRVAVVCDVDPRRAQTLADRAEGCAVATAIDAVLADPAIDIVDVCLPPSLHFETALRALEAGKHVVCEKPIAGSVRDADRLAAAAEAAGRLVVPVFQYRFGHGIRQLRHLVVSGLAGRPYTATLETHWDRDAAYYDVAWRGTWKGELGGALVSHAIHAHDLLCFVLGPVAHVAAFLGTRVNAIENEDCGSIAMQMGNGALVTSSITLGASDNTSRLKFCFEKLTAESGLAAYHPGGADWRFTARAPMRQEALDAALASVAPAPDLYAGFFAELAQELRGKPSDSVHLADGRQSLELASAIYAAARTGTIVALPLAADDPICRGWRPTSGTRP